MFGTVLDVVFQKNPRFLHLDSRQWTGRPQTNYVPKTSSNFFSCTTNDLVNSFTSNLQCLDCRKKLIDVNKCDSNLLKRIKLNNSAERTELAMEILQKFEFNFNKLNQSSSLSSSLISFLDIATSQIAMLHCDETLELLAANFFKMRLQLCTGRFIHRANKFASKSLK